MLEWLTHTPYAIWVQQSWGWPFALTFHALGNATIIGLSFIIALRIFGAFRTMPYSALTKFIPIIWISVVVQALSGFSLFLTKPAKYFGDGMFQWKLAFVVAGIASTSYLQQVLKREVAGWDTAQTTTARGRQIVVVTALVWAGVLVMGRLTAYLGQLYHVF